MKYLAFDLEISTSIPEGTSDWKELRPLGISCAAAYKVAGDYRFNYVWHGEEQDDGRYAERMTPEQCRGMAHTLMALHGLGFTLVTFNGLGFDLDVLAEECDDNVTYRTVRALARNHIDVAFAFFADKGFMPSLSNAAKGMRLEGKTEGMSGALAPDMWAGSREEQDKVLEYVERDAVLTGELYEAVMERGVLSWMTRAGRISSWRPSDMGRTPEGDGRLLTVNECLKLPEPDNSWMDEPWTRDKFASWLYD